MFPRSIANHVARTFSQPAGLRRVTAAVIRQANLALGRASQRQALSELTDDQLRDIGLSRGEAFREAAKPFWRP